MKTLEGKVAIVTGAGRPKGMGRATALMLAREGASVVVTDLARRRNDLEIKDTLGVGDDIAELEQLAAQIESLGSKALALPVDVTDRSQIQACIRKTCDTFGGIDILFNNAGTAVGTGPFLEISEAHWDLSYEINLKGMVHFCQLVIPKMIERGGGSIINNSSLAGLGVVDQMAAYSATKFAVIGLTKAIAAEFGHQHIRCNAVCPGLIRTDMGEAEIKIFADSWATSLEDAEKQLTEPVAMKRWAEPEEVAAVVVFLAGPAAGYLTGAALPVAGGLAPGL